MEKMGGRTTIKKDAVIKMVVEVRLWKDETDWKRIKNYQG